MGYLDALTALLKKCRMRSRAASGATDETVVPMWKERGVRVALIMASQMVEMKVCNPSLSSCVQGNKTHFFIYRNYLQQLNYSNHLHLNPKQVQHSNPPLLVSTSRQGNSLAQSRFSLMSKQTKQ